MSFVLQSDLACLITSSSIVTALTLTLVAVTINDLAGDGHRSLIGLVVYLLILIGCAGASDPVDTTDTADTSDAVVPTEGAQPTVRAEPTPTPVEAPAQDRPEPGATATGPVVRVPENPGTVEATNWLARNFMDAQSVDLVWSPVEGAEVYRLYRLPTATADYVAIGEGDLSGTSLVYEGTATGFIDTDVESDTFLTYVLVAQVGNDLTAPRWTQALTVDDTTPPTPITGLVANTTPDGVLLEWEMSTDDVEFASYSVSVLDDGELKYIGGGADESQTSFLDTNPVDGATTYEVVAVDFHDNRSEPARVEIEVDIEG